MPPSRHCWAQYIEPTVAPCRQVPPLTWRASGPLDLAAGLRSRHWCILNHQSCRSNAGNRCLHGRLQEGVQAHLGWGHALAGVGVQGDMDEVAVPGVWANGPEVWGSLV